MKRKLYHKLCEWKSDSNGKTALLINGARRVGKSYLCEEFARNEYESYILIDFGNVPNEIIDLFDNESYDLDLFFIKLSAFYQVKLYKRKSIIIFDEVQLLPKARQLIKYLVKDGRYDYIETGSLLSIKMNVEDIIIPSEERHLELHPMDFEEFLWALGDDITIPSLKTFFDSRKPLGNALHRKILNLYRQYILVGGMPQAVLEYSESKDFEKVDKIKKDILNLYRNDVSKYAGIYKNKVISVFDSIPSQLSKKDKRFKITTISKHAKNRNYEDAFIWLDDAMITNSCFNSTDPNVGLKLYADYSTRKSFMSDTGLLITHAFMDKNTLNNQLYRSILLDKLSVNEGMIMENIVAQTFRVNGHSLYFYKRSDHINRQNHIEIDFLIIRGTKISPIEVKSSSYRKHSSLDKFKTKFSKRIGESYIIYQKDLMVKDGVIHIPVYMSMFL